MELARFHSLTIIFLYLKLVNSKAAQVISWNSRPIRRKLPGTSKCFDCNLTRPMKVPLSNNIEWHWKCVGLSRRYSSSSRSPGQDSSSDSCESEFYYSGRIMEMTNVIEERISWDRTVMWWDITLCILQTEMNGPRLLRGLVLKEIRSNPSEMQRSANSRCDQISREGETLLFPEHPTPQRPHNPRKRYNFWLQAIWLLMI
jgi:hypothetical protein